MLHGSQLHTVAKTVANVQFYRTLGAIPSSNIPTDVSLSFSLSFSLSVTFKHTFYTIFPYFEFILAFPFSRPIFVPLLFWFVFLLLLRFDPFLFCFHCVCVLCIRFIYIYHMSHTLIVYVNTFSILLLLLLFWLVSMPMHDFNWILFILLRLNSSFTRFIHLHSFFMLAF